MRLSSRYQGGLILASLLLASSAEAQQVQTKTVVMQPQLFGSISCPANRVCLTSNAGNGRPWFVDLAGGGWPADEARALYRSTTAPPSIAGAAYFNSLTNQFLLYVSGVWYETATTSSIQTLSNKTLGSHLAAGGFRVTGLGAPSSATDAATKGYVDGLLAPGTQVYGVATGGGAGLLGIATVHLRAPGQAASGTVVTALHRTTRAGTLRNLTCALNIAPGGADTVAVNLEVNGVALAVACTMTGAGTTCSDNVNTSAVAANNSVAMRAISSGAVASDLACSVEVTN